MIWAETTVGAIVASLLALTLPAGQSYALPAGEQVTAGSAAVQRVGPALTVSQSTQNVAINWKNFGIASSESVRFNQPNASSIALNRVLGQDPSQIFGSMSANGQVFILNPNGVLFGKGAQVNVGGLVASTLNMTDHDFMASRYALTANAMAGSVANQAAIVTADGGYVAFIAPRVSNTGSIIAPMGKVALTAGDKVTLMISNGSLFGVAVDQGTLKALVENKGAVYAGGGAVVLTARSMDLVSRSVVNNSGIIEAGTLSNTNGVIHLEGDVVHISGTLSATAIDGRGGRISATGETVGIAAGTSIDVSGKTGGGLIEVGGGWQGGGTLPHATNVIIEPGAALLANATGQGDGGIIAVWSDGATRVSGSLEARGAGTGHGGMIETSGHLLDVTGSAVNASAPVGAGGTWLLDPHNLTVSGAATTATEIPAGTWTSSAGGSVVLNSNINAALNVGTSVVLQTSGALGDGAGNGDITISAAIAKTAGANAGLILKAAGSIIVNAGIGSTVGAIAVTLNSNTLGGGGYVKVAAPVTTNGGTLVIGGGATPLTDAAVGTAIQGRGVLISSALSAGGGDITINGTGLNSSANSSFGIHQLAAIGTSGAGNITLNGSGGGTGNNEMGVVSNANITTGIGHITITGAASPTAAFIFNHGVNVAGGVISTTGAGTVTVNGTATGTAAGVQSYGVIVQGGASITAADGLISVTGDNHSTGSGVGNNGVYIKGAGSMIESTGTGGMTVTGFGGGSGTSASNFGVIWDAANGIRSTGTGAITVTGTGGDAGGSGNGNFGVYANAALNAIGGPITITGVGGGEGGTGGLNHGVNLSAALAGAGGAISITGVGGNSNGTGNSGITQVAAITNTGTGSITLNGTGGGTRIQEIGVSSNASITAGTGNILVAGLASATATGSSSHGVQFRGGTTSTNGAGTITIAGTAIGTAAGADTYGVSVVGGAVITAVDGLISVTGTNNSVGTGAGNNGVYVTGAGSTIQSTGNGSISIAGTPGNSGGGSNFGIFLNSITAGTGTLTLNSTGAVTSTGALTAANLNLLGAGGTHVLTNGGNGVGILAANTGSVNYSQNGDLAISTVDGTAGVTVSGTVLLNSTGNLTLESGAGVSAGGSGDALVLIAGNNFINTAGTGALSAAAGRWLVYSTSPAGSFENGLTVTAGSALPRLYGRTYAASGPATIAAPGNHLLYSAQPTLIVVADGQARVYGNANPAFTYTSGGYVVDDGVTDNPSSAGLVGAPSLTTSATGTSNVGGYAINAAAGTLVSGAGYAFGFAPNVLVVTPRPLLINADDKSKIQGAANPLLTATGTGFANGEGFGDLGGALNVTTPAVTSSPDGSYPITPSGQTSTNYAITYTNGVLLIRSTASDPLLTGNANVDAALASSLYEDACVPGGGTGPDTEAQPVHNSRCAATARALRAVRIIGAGMRLPEGMLTNLVADDSVRNLTAR